MRIKQFYIVVIKTFECKNEESLNQSNSRYSVSIISQVENWLIRFNRIDI